MHIFYLKIRCLHDPILNTLMCITVKDITDSKTRSDTENHVKIETGRYAWSSLAPASAQSRYSADVTAHCSYLHPNTPVYLERQLRPHTTQA